jgi:hypothetical protein
MVAERPKVSGSYISSARAGGRTIDGSPGDGGPGERSAGAVRQPVAVPAGARPDHRGLGGSAAWAAVPEDCEPGR